MNESQMFIKVSVEMNQAMAAFKQLQSTVLSTSAQMKSWGQGMIDSGRKLTALGKQIQWSGQQLTMGLTLPIVYFAQKSIKAAQDFNYAMGTVAAAAQTTTQQTDANFKAMENAALEMGKTSLFSSEEAAKGLYELVSAGMSAKDAAVNLRPAVKFAEAAQIDLGNATQFAAQMLKVFGDKNHDTARLMDITSIAVQKSQAHFGDFVHNVQMSSAFAKAANQSYEQLAAALMVLADRGVPAATAGFQLRQAFSQMIKPSNQAAEAIKKLGLKLYDAKGKFKPLSNILGQLRKKTKGMTDEQKNMTLATLFNVRAGQAMRTLLQLSDKDYNKYLKIVGESAGVTEEMAKTVEESNPLLIQQNRLNEQTIRIGQQLIPIKLKLYELLSKLLDAYNNLSPGMKKFVNGIAIGLAVVGPFLIYLGLLIQSFGLLKTGIGVVTKTLGGLSNLGTILTTGFGAGLAILLAISIAMIAISKSYNALQKDLDALHKSTERLKESQKIWQILIKKHPEKVKQFETIKKQQDELIKENEKLEERYRGFKGVLNAIFDTWIQPWIDLKNRVKKKLEEFPGMVSEWAKDLGNRAYNALADAGESIETWFRELPGKIFNFLADIGESISNWFRELPGKIWEAFIGINEKIAFGLAAMTGLVVIGIPKLIDIIVTFFKELPGKIWNALVGLKNRIKERFSEVKTQVKEDTIKATNDARDRFARLPGDIWNALVNLKNRIKERFITTYNDLKTSLTTWLNNIVNWFKQLPGRIWSALVDLKNKIKTKFQNALNSVLDWINSLPGKFKEAAVSLKNAVIDGLTFGFGTRLYNAWNAGLAWAKKLLESKSPPKEGPLKNLDKWGFAAGQSYIENFQKAFETLSIPEISARGAESLRVVGNKNSLSAPTASTFNQSQGKVINIQQVIINANTRAEGLEAGRAFKQELQSI